MKKILKLGPAHLFAFFENTAMQHERKINK
jgi:hypothetical protein